MLSRVPAGYTWAGKVKTFTPVSRGSQARPEGCPLTDSPALFPILSCTPDTPMQSTHQAWEPSKPRVLSSQALTWNCRHKGTGCGSCVVSWE